MSKLDRFNRDELKDNPRATFKAWQRYEELVVRAFRSYPEPYIYSDNRLSPETIVSRARDAIRGKIAFDYPSTVSSSDLTEWFSKVAFRVINHSVHIGPREQTKIEPPLVQEKKDATIFDTLDQAELTAIAFLLSRGRLSGPITVRYPDVTLIVPQYPNFHSLKRPDGSLVLL